MASNPSSGGAASSAARGEARRAAAEKDVLERMKGRGQTIPGMPAEVQASVNRTADHHALTLATIERATRVNEETNTTGGETLVTLGRQRETLEHANETTELTLENLRQGRLTIRDIKRGIMKEKAVKILVILALVLTIWIIIYVKWIRRH